MLPARHSKDHKLKEIKRLTPEAFEHTTTDMWSKFCRHVIDVENEHFEKDGILEDRVEEMEEDCPSIAAVAGHPFRYPS